MVVKFSGELKSKMDVEIKQGKNEMLYESKTS